jgi:hypothetical protein
MLKPSVGCYSVTTLLLLFTIFKKEQLEMLVFTHVLLCGNSWPLLSFKKSWSLVQVNVNTVKLSA